MGELYTGTDVCVIGAGPGGYVAAIRAAQLGKDVMLIDKAELGGVCLNVGCIPSKALISAAHIISSLKDAEVMGIECVGLKVNIKKMQAWKEGVVKKLIGGIEGLCKKYDIEVVKGEALFEGSNKIKINGHPDIEGIQFKQCIIATGSVPIEIPGFTFDEKTILSSTGALALQEIPKSMIVIGGGVVGLELGMVYAKLGSKVTVVEFAGQLLGHTDPEIVKYVDDNVHHLGMDVYLEAKAESWKEENGRAVVTIDSKEKGKMTLTADKILLAVGRKPNTKKLELEHTKVELDDHGFIKVDNKMCTADPSIYAIGDVAGQPMLAHKASREGKVAAEVIAGKKSAYDNQVVPDVIFTDPEIATAGLDEAQAKEKGYEVNVGRFPCAASGRALTMNISSGLTKIVSDKKTGLLLGAQIVGPHASDMISELALAIEMGALTEDVRSTIHPHPTFPETIMEAAEDVNKEAIHIFHPKK